MTSASEERPAVLSAPKKPMTAKNLFDELFEFAIPQGAPGLRWYDIIVEGEDFNEREEAAASVSEHAAQRRDESTTDAVDAKQTTNTAAVGGGPEDAVVAVETDASIPLDANAEDVLVELDLSDMATREAQEHGDSENRSLGEDGEGGSDNHSTTAENGTDANKSASDGRGERATGSSTRQTTAELMNTEEQLARMVPGSDEVFRGTVVLFHHQKAFGFVSPSIGGPDVYVTRESLTLPFSRALDAFLSDDAAVSAMMSLGALTQSMREEWDRGLMLLQLAKPFLVGGEPIEFKCAWNLQGGANRRKLRAVEVTGPERGPLRIERVLLRIGCGRQRADGSDESEERIAETLFPTVLKERVPEALQASYGDLFFRPIPALTLSPEHANVGGAAEAGGSVSEMFTGGRYAAWVKNLSESRDRGYLRPDARAAASSSGAPGGEGEEASPYGKAASPGYELLVGSQDAVLHAELLIWDRDVPEGERFLEEGVLVEYSVVSYDKQGKPIAAFVTSRGGVPLHPLRWELTDAAKRLRAARFAEEEDEEGGGRAVADGTDGLRQSDSVGGGGRTGAPAHPSRRNKRREREADAPLLLLDDDAAMW